MRVTKELIYLKLRHLADVANLPISKQEAIEAGAKSYLAIDNSSMYGGYRMIMINVLGGGMYGAFGYSDCCDRLKPREFVDRINAIIHGIEYAK